MRQSFFLFLSAGFLFFAIGGVQAQSAKRGVDWSQPAVNLSTLNAQILEWHSEFEALSGQPVTKETLAGILTLHFQKGPIVLSGMKAMQDWWTHNTSDSEKKSRYLAVSQYFANHTIDLGSSWAWDWYRCFGPPLSPRYNFLAADAGLPPILANPNDGDLLSGLSADDRLVLFQQCRPAITDYLSRNNYPLTEDSIAKMTLDSQGIFLSGRYPKQRDQLNKDFTFSGSALFLFGMGM